MKKHTIITYLDELLSKKVSKYDTAIDWAVKNYSIELVFRLFAENIIGETIDDVSGTSSEEDIIEFEDSILLYHPEKTIFNKEDYLVAIPYEGKKGMKQSVLNGLIDTLLFILMESQNDLEHFLIDEKETIFQLDWPKELFEEKVQQYQTETQDMYIPYPKY